MTRCMTCVVLLTALLGAGCASNDKPKLPYPAFEQADELPDMFIAALPGVRAKPLAGDMRTQTSSVLLTLPPDWSGTTGGAPGKAVELFVLSGEILLSEFKLGPGGYAYVPPGSLGFGFKSDRGAQLLYFLDAVDDASVIRSPLILDSRLVEWQEIAPGRYVRELRKDPGSGARAWLLRIEPGVGTVWTSSTQVREGFMISGSYQHSECFNGVEQTWQYGPGGYFLRPPETFNGGANAIATTETTWFLREQGASLEVSSDVCFYTEPVQPSTD